MIGSVVFVAFQLDFMPVAVDTVNRHVSSNKMRRQLQPKKIKVMLYHLFAKDIYPTLLTYKMECFSFKSGSIIWVKNGEMRCQL